MYGMGDLASGMLVVCMLSLALALLFLVCWTVIELPRSVRKWLEFRRYRKSHRFYGEVRKSWLKIFYI